MTPSRAVSPPTCTRCARPILYPLTDCVAAHRAPVWCAVRHDFYGCDTGCCGHSVYGYDEEGRTVFRKFYFDHPGLGDAGWAQALAHGALPGVPCVILECNLLEEEWYK